MRGKIHEFENAIRVYDFHLTDAQRRRYAKRNVHEAEEEDIFIEILESIPTNGCFVNIGSAIGYYPILAKKLSPNITIHAFEPLALFREYFAENILLNGFNLQSFSVHEEGVYSSDGYVKFLNHGYGSKIAKTNYVSMKQVKRAIVLVIKRLLTYLKIKTYKANTTHTTIKVISLHALLEMIGRPVDLLLMDIQGVEPDVLEGGKPQLQSGSIKTLLIGTHGSKLHSECIRTLTSCGYLIEFEKHLTKHQPDGIIVASKEIKRLRTSNSLGRQKNNEGI